MDGIPDAAHKGAAGEGGGAVIGRANMVEADPGKVEEGIAFVRDRIRPVVDSLPGSRGLGMWVNRETGQVVVHTVWEDRAALDGSESRLADLRAEVARVMEARSVRVEVVEPGVMWQAAADQPGYWARHVEMTVPVARVEEGISLFRDEALPAIRQFPGVNTCVLLVNRETGLSMVNVTYRSKDDLEAAQERATALRASMVDRLEGSPPVVWELETTIVGIRGPEPSAPPDSVAGEPSPS